MRIRIAHSIVYRYEPPAAGVIQMLRLTPRNHDGQYVVGWRIDVSGDARLDAHEDAFGNLTHVFTADGPFADLTRQGRRRGRDPGYRRRRARHASSGFRRACSCATRR